MWKCGLKNELSSYNRSNALKSEEVRGWIKQEKSPKISGKTFPERKLNFYPVANNENWKTEHGIRIWSNQNIDSFIHPFSERIIMYAIVYSMLDW